jgi:hypothetical protein
MIGKHITRTMIAASFAVPLRGNVAAAGNRTTAPESVAKVGAILTTNTRK